MRFAHSQSSDQLSSWGKTSPSHQSICYAIRRKRACNSSWIFPLHGLLCSPFSRLLQKSCKSVNLCHQVRAPSYNVDLRQRCFTYRSIDLNLFKLSGKVSSSCEDGTHDCALLFHGGQGMSFPAHWAEMSRQCKFTSSSCEGDRLS